MVTDLYQKRILVTREKKQAKAFSTLIKESNGISIEVPLLEIRTKQENPFIAKSLKDIEWIFFTSVNGVNSFFELVQQTEQLEACQFAAVGTKTAQALESKGYTAQFIPTTFNAETMADEFAKQYGVQGKLLLVRGNRSRDVLPKKFTQKGYSIELVEVYETIHHTEAKAELNHVLLHEQIDLLTFTSPSTIDSFCQIVDPAFHFQKVPAVCIGTTTAKRAEKAGFDSIIMPESFTIEGMVNEMGEYLKRKENDDGNK